MQRRGKFCSYRLLILAVLVCITSPHTFGATRLTIVLSQSTDPAGVLASLSTTETYPCEGYRIRTSVTQSFDTLTIHIGGIVRPVPCFLMLGKANGEAFLGKTILSIWILRLTYQDRNDLYNITLENNSFTIRPIVATFTDISNELP